MQHCHKHGKVQHCHKRGKVQHCLLHLMYEHHLVQAPTCTTPAASLSTTPAERPADVPRVQLSGVNRQAVVQDMLNHSRNRLLTTFLDIVDFFKPRWAAV